MAAKLQELLSGANIKTFAAIIGVLIILSSAVGLLAPSQEEIVLDRPASETRAGALISLERMIAGREQEYYVLSLTDETGTTRFLVEPAYADCFDRDAFLALVPPGSVVEVTAELQPCESGSDLYPVLAVSSGGEEYLSYSDAVKCIGSVRKKSTFANWLFILIGAALTVPAIINLVSGPRGGSSSGRVIRTRRSTLPIRSKYAKQ